MSADPTWTPPLLESVRSRSHHRIFVTGLDSVLGRAVATIAYAAGAEVVGIDAPTEDAGPTKIHDVNPRTGSGLDVALRDVQAIVDCATFAAGGASARESAVSPATHVRHLTAAIAAWAPKAHLVLPTASGCWQSTRAWHRHQGDAENTALAEVEKVSIMRSTQLHPEAYALTQRTGSTFTGRTASLRITPTDPAWLAARLVDVALRPRALDHVAEFAGPETFTVADLVTLTRHLGSRAGRSRAAVPALRYWRDAADVVGAVHPGTERGGLRYEQWWQAQRG